MNTIETPMQTIINKCKTLMPKEGEDYYYTLEDLVCAMQEMEASYEASMRRKEFGMAEWPFKRFFRLRDEFLSIAKEIATQAQ